jgi:Pyridoxamine 5'-phosphate oxidase
VNRRAQIRMSPSEVRAFLAERRTMSCATLGPRGWPHVMPLWYVLREPVAGGEQLRVWAWTYAASQKMRNLERDARATLQFEAGETYEQLRGVMLECEAIVHADVETVAALGRELFGRYAPRAGQPTAAVLTAEVAREIERQAPKRVALEFVEHRRASWDHRKLA